jgi:hypothetical protein
LKPSRGIQEELKGNGTALMKLLARVQATKA